MVSRRVEIIKFTFSSYHCVELFNHNAEGVEFVLIGVYIDENVFFDEKSTNFNIAHILRETYKC